MTNPQKVTPPKYIPGNQLEKIAEEILSTYGVVSQLPVDIERLCDLMGIKTLLVPNLSKDFSVDAYITDDCSTIVVDESSFFKFENRARFSIAHELSHHILHKEFLSQFKIDNIADYLAFQDVLDADMRKTIEIQAFILAGYLLIPTKTLKQEVTAIVGTIDARTININQIGQVLELLQPKFAVSTLALAKQLSRTFPEFAEIIKPLLGPTE